MRVSNETHLIASQPWNALNTDDYRGSIVESDSVLKHKDYTPGSGADTRMNELQDGP